MRLKLGGYRAGIMLDDIAAAFYALPVIGEGGAVFDPETLALAERVLAGCRARRWRVATAESCTGGLVAAALSAIAGASDVVERGFVTYSNRAKMELLGVPADTIAAHGGVSAETAAAMARGAVARAGVDLAVSVTGLAGPGGGTPQKPVGLVYLGVARKDGAARIERRIFPGDRGQVRQAAVVLALELLQSEAAG
jgi:nicotinamide-nucleotide amidase